jgi:hypothetical protein
MTAVSPYCGAVFPLPATSLFTPYEIRSSAHQGKGEATSRKPKQLKGLCTAPLHLPHLRAKATLRRIEFSHFFACILFRPRTLS